MTQKISAFLRQFVPILFSTRRAVSISPNVDQKQIEESLRASEEKYRSVVENIGHGSPFFVLML